MSSDFSVRQLLACLNISVFDPLVEPVLKKACQIDAAQLTKKKDPFHGIFSLIVWQIASFICFLGLRPYAVPMGLLLIVFCAVAIKRITSVSGRFFFKVYFFSGVLLLAEKLFCFFPFIVPVIILCFLLQSAFCLQKREMRAVLAFWFFITVLLIFWNHFRNFVPVVIGCFSLVGITGLLFPLKNVYWREPSVMFAVLPLFFILFYETAVLIQIMTPMFQNRSVIAFFVMFESLMLIFCLYKDLDLSEFILFCLVTIGLYMCTFLLSDGLGGSVVLFFTAFFIDAHHLGRIAAILFTCFLILFFLSLPISLFAAGMVSMLSGILFVLCRLYIKRKILWEKER